MTQPIVAGVMLVGGRSSRMGQSKAWLDWHGTPLARRTLGLLRRGVDGPLVVVAAPDQDLPELPPGTAIVRDPIEGRGPLQGIAVGLAAAGTAGADHAFVCAVDMPLLHPAFVRRVCALIGGAAVTVPLVAGFRQPLAARYDVTLASAAAELAAGGKVGPGKLFAEVDVRWVEPAELLSDEALRRQDPTLRSVTNTNDRDTYDRVVGGQPPQVSVKAFGAVALGSPQGGQDAEVRAWSVGAAAAEIGVAMDGHVVAAIDGDHLTSDPTTPLAGGEQVSLLSADAGG